MAAVACAPKKASNPFLTEWDTPYGIPDFSAVEEEHYLPAVEAGIEQQQAEIDAISLSHYCVTISPGNSAPHFAHSLPTWQDIYTNTL